MGRFPHRIAIVSTVNGRDAIFQQHLDYVADDGTQYRVPEGSPTDGASVPQALWSTGIAPFGPYWLALAGMHDSGYRGTLQRIDAHSEWVPANLSREQCDNLAREAMRALGVEEAVVTLIFDALRVAGGLAFWGDRV